MNKIVHYIGLDVHKDSIAVAIAPQNSTEVRRYGIIGGTLDAVDNLLKRLSRPNIELRLVYEAGPCGLSIDAKAGTADRLSGGVRKILRPSRVSSLTP
jgi:hypothetical protein